MRQPSPSGGSSITTAKAGRAPPAHDSRLRFDQSRPHRRCRAFTHSRARRSAECPSPPCPAARVTNQALAARRAGKAARSPAPSATTTFAPPRSRADRCWRRSRIAEHVPAPTGIAMIHVEADNPELDHGGRAPTRMRFRIGSDAALGPKPLLMRLNCARRGGDLAHRAIWRRNTRAIANPFPYRLVRSIARRVINRRARSGGTRRGVRRASLTARVCHGMPARIDARRS